MVRFAERWHRLYPDKRIDGRVEEVLLVQFARAHRIEPKTRRYRRRLESHGKDTLYFSAPPFVFVVQDAALMTVELATAPTRHLNYHQPSSPAPPPAPPPKPPPAKPPEPREPPAVAVAEGFRASGFALNEEGALKWVSLGRYSREGCIDDATALVGDRELMAVMLERLAEKRPAWRLVSVFLVRGKRGAPVTVLDETDFWLTSGGPSRPEPAESAPRAEARKTSA